MRTASFAVAILSIALSHVAVAADEDFSGIVTKVFDGDSFIVEKERTTERRRSIDVRLMDIDAPEKHQPYGDTARTALKSLIDGRRVFVDVIDTDQYGRKIAKVYREPDRVEIARALVQDGHVWVNRRFARDRTLIAAEDEARSQHRGLWSLPNGERIPPWQFRREMRAREQQRAH